MSDVGESSEGDEFDAADTSGELSRDSKAENTKGNDQETESKEGQIEATNETVVVDINEPVKEINAVKDSVTIDLKAKLATLEEEAPRGE